jgi:hypothetical protein
LADKAEEQNKKKRWCHDLWRAWRQAQNDPDRSNRRTSFFYALPVPTEKTCGRDRGWYPRSFFGR